MHTQSNDLFRLYPFSFTLSTDEDYNGTSVVRIIAASSGSSKTCFDIAITDDDIIENSEEFVVSFQISPASNAALGVVTSANVLIVDDDGEYTFTQSF